MAHELDFSTGQAAIALKGGAKTAWHGLGQTIEPGDSIKTIQRKAGLNWEALTAPVVYRDAKGGEHSFDGQQVIYRSDTNKALGVTSESRYNIVQPAQVMEFFCDFLADNKLSIETAGAVRGGRIIWAMAKLGKDYDFILPGKDRVDGYFRLQTSFDGTRATDGVGTTIRQVCANTMRMVDCVADRCGYRTPHSAKFDATGLQRAFGLLGKQYQLTAEIYNAMVKRKVTCAETDKFFLDLYGIDPEELKATDKEGKPVVSTRQKNVLASLADAFTNSPGAQLPSARGTAYGLLQAVTYFVDHKASSQDNYEDGKDVARRNAAWFGKGETLKSDAQWFAAELAGVNHLIDRVEAVAA